MRSTAARVLVAALTVVGFSTLAWSQPAAPKVSRPARGAKVDLNTARVNQLETLPGMTPAIARAIVEARPLRSLADLKRIRGVTPLIYASIAPHAMVSETAVEPPGTGPLPVEKGHLRASGGRVNLNTASLEELEALPGIGPARAGLIVKARPFESVEQLKAIRGISPKEYASLTHRVTVGEPEAPSPAPSATRPRSPRATAPLPPATRPGSPRATAPEPPERASEKKMKPPLAPGQTININSATLEELEELPGIGPVHGEAIIQARPFATIEDIMKVKGIKEKEFAKIKDVIRVR